MKRIQKRKKRENCGHQCYNINPHSAIKYSQATYLLPMSAVHVLLGFPDMALSISAGRTETEIRKGKIVAADAWTKFFTSILCSSVIFINFIDKCTSQQH